MGRLYYAASLLAGQKAKENGYSQVLWLDGIERRYIEEVGAMNIFFVIDDELITPELSGSILPGVTRDSVLQLAKIEAANWVKTYYNQKEGVRFCVWLAPDREALKKTFSDMDVSWESMHEVEETKPDLWGEKRWKKHLEAEATADTLGD